MSEFNRAGAIFANGVLAGRIYEYVEHGNETYKFCYDSKYLTQGSPIGYSLPLTAEPYLFDRLPPFFENLISEGWLRAHQSARARLDKEDSFGLLLANGRELIGALSVVPLESK